MHRAVEKGRRELCKGNMSRKGVLKVEARYSKIHIIETLSCQADSCDLHLCATPCLWRFQPIAPYLPPGLIENTIEQLDYGETLSAYGLTSRAWAHIALTKYLRNLKFGKPPDRMIHFLEIPSLCHPVCACVHPGTFECPMTNAMTTFPFCCSLFGFFTVGSVVLMRWMPAEDRLVALLP
jgi:hypothetical protein